MEVLSLPRSLMLSTPCIFEDLPVYLQGKKNDIHTIKIFHRTMTKAEVVSDIAKSTGVDKETTLAVVEAFMESVKDSLVRGENVYLRGFGSFIIKERAEKTARNISKKTTIIIPKRRIPAFKPSKLFASKVK